MPTEAEVRARIAGVPHWYHRIELLPGVVTPGVTDSSEYLGFLGLPRDCRGLRVLDLGTRDGYYAFAFERMGAEVLAVDYLAAAETGFAVCADVLGSRVEYLQANIYELTPQRLGTFDVILFLGLLYHLPDPLGAIHVVRGLARGQTFLETQILDNAVVLPDGTFATLAGISPVLTRLPLMQFYPGTTLAGDPTNYWAPNVACLTGMLEECNFAIEAQEVRGSRAIFRCRGVEDARKEHFIRVARGEERPRF